MNSISSDCQDLKNQYDTCFNRWFRDKFLKGHVEDAACSELFKSYQLCVKVFYLLGYIAAEKFTRFKIGLNNVILNRMSG